MCSVTYNAKRQCRIFYLKSVYSPTVQTHDYWTLMINIANYLIHRLTRSRLTAPQNRENIDFRDRIDQTAPRVTSAILSSSLTARAAGRV